MPLRLGSRQCLDEMVRWAGASGLQEFICQHPRGPNSGTGVTNVNMTMRTKSFIQV
ncbi:MAG: hypothetical protein ACI8PT_003606 [Gammaproteobacteria bacterium]|jgi:hypothetical protein